MQKQKRDKFIFRCQSCGGQTPKWMGRCPDCNAWDTLVEEQISSGVLKKKKSSFLPEPVLLDSVEVKETDRIKTGVGEFDRVLGGGIVDGTLILIGGDPGIGKSTLMLQVLSSLSSLGKKCLYVSGEESVRQISMRGKRLNSHGSSMFVVSETDLDSILAMVGLTKYDALVIDSIQTVFHPDVSSTPGSVTQIREAAMKFMKLAKTTGLPIFLVGHVTKVGAIAGPRIMEHMVDTVLYFEGDKSHVFRILRAVKNRFGSTNEIGVFEMNEKGLIEVPNPSAVFLAERSAVAPGSVVTSCMEGTRPILVEIQGLVSSSSGTPRRTILGLDSHRVALIVAVMEKRLGMNLTGLDIFMNVTGGVKIVEPAVDLAIATALASTFLDKPVDKETTLIGEIGLTGEIRAVGHVQARIKEACKMGFTKCLVPSSTIKQLSKIKGMTIESVSFLKDAMEVLF
ncbi:MAG: DNA repair protein RadA [Desulfobacula sp.]|jgi:DNA repair protein RadA/Sms|uniref:DNA repair protein RadA n=1 Tax=Desulfobacula sp. TaxID=2593537 RepID=UPI001DF1146E|nr:DNA repair protein RadA [Desulfobacula sp.]MBT3486380.1 DNA repair protein RadA [Desulfobacula sp.]MBT3805356.1 DNA repair protein RadA [Desulfobacula sp.]MBT4024510.1 DNA repair protein RadA [Desulfobacula sp.]MBT4199826.1 DNA repair protein RadA [Desulfobacula sp.]